MLYHDFMDDPWCPSEISWTKDSVGKGFEVLFTSEPCRDVTRSQCTFETTVKHVKSLFPHDMACFKYLGMKLIDPIYIPKDLDNIKLLLPRLGCKYVASRYDQSSKHVFQPFAFGNKK